MTKKEETDGTIQSATTIIARLEDGRVDDDTTEAITDLIKCMRRFGDQKVKGQVVLTLDFTHQGGAMTITRKIGVKKPQRSGSTTFYTTEAGTLSYSNPKQGKLTFAESSGPAFKDDEKKGSN